jgi:hypothetical protein
MMHHQYGMPQDNTFHLRYVKRKIITSVKARCVIIEYGDGLNMCMLRSFAKCVAKREARALQ